MTHLDTITWNLDAPRSRRTLMLRLFAVVVVLGLVGCTTSEPAAPASVFLPRLDHSNDVWPSALMVGTLQESNGCVFIKVGYKDVVHQRMLLIWPQETRAVRTEDGKLRILLGDTIVGEMGDHVELGGGVLSESPEAVGQAESLIGEPIPERCRANHGYWLTYGP